MADGSVRPERPEKSTTPQEVLPLVPLRDIVVFPHLVVPFQVGRPSSIQALRYALAQGLPVFLVSQKDKEKENPTQKDLHAVGCVAAIVQHLELENGQIRILIEGKRRARLKALRQDGPLLATVEPLDLPGMEGPTDDVIATAKKAHGLFTQYAKLHPTPITETALGQLKPEEPARLADGIAAHMAVPADEKQAILEKVDLRERLAHILKLLEIEIEKREIDRKIATRVKKQMDKAQREYYLNEKVKAIYKELGRKDDRVGEVDALKKKVEESGLSTEAKEKALEEIRRLEMMPPVSAEATVSRNYIQWLIDVPWSKKSRGNKDIEKAREILEEDHYGLDKVKERILEYLAVRTLVKHPKGPILCLVGPPGVGKTSLAKSIARATGRNYVRLSLGGIRDEAEIRGHRRTYIGAFPGQIIQMMKKAGACNPVFLLDEVDKVGMDFRGDPTAALLEVLDPEQNHMFLDHYLDVPYDLSQVMFLATANVLHPISPALLDRLEVLHIPSYTHLEKRQIARRFLLPKNVESHGLKPANLAVSDGALDVLIDRYTREAGVRNLEREIGNLCRKVARRVAREGADVSESVDEPGLARLLGPARFHKGAEAQRAEVGTAMGLAWTEVGGQTLLVECSCMPGKGRLTLTGKMGEVMRESAHAAVSIVRARAEALGIDADFHKKLDIHIHIPEGAIPKDGPSAGVTLVTALVSRLTGRPVRHDIAMTGEITLGGKVLPIGGLREKLLAAYRAGIVTIIAPAENARDPRRSLSRVRDRLDVRTVSRIDEVLAIAILPGRGGGRTGPARRPGRAPPPSESAARRSARIYSRGDSTPARQACSSAPVSPSLTHPPLAEVRHGSRHHRAS
ncbi:MAG: endopeptidase La [bacterium]